MGGRRSPLERFQGLTCGPSLGASVLRFTTETPAFHSSSTTTSPLLNSTQSPSRIACSWREIGVFALRGGLGRMWRVGRWRSRRIWRRCRGLRGGGSVLVGSSVSYSQTSYLSTSHSHLYTSSSSNRLSALSRISTPKCTFICSDFCVRGVLF